VLVLIEYRIEAENREQFLRALKPYARLLRRDGAYDFGIYEDPADEGRYVETFMTDSWVNHLRLHRRLTNADRTIEQAVRRFQVGEASPATHLVFARPRE
jgi:quinol monooxygenase YgiN